MKTYYKIIEEKDEELYFLHHGINGSKKIQLNEWIEADIKEKVRDGSGGKRYTSGIHIIDGFDNVITYASKFKKDRKYVIVRCHAEEVRMKEHSKDYVYLANRIKIIK